MADTQDPALDGDALEAAGFGEAKPHPGTLFYASGPLTSLGCAVLLVFSLSLGASVPDSGVRLPEVIPHGPADSAGLQAGDLIRSIDGTPVTSLTDISRYVRRAAHAPLVFEVERGEARLRLPVLPRYFEDVGVLGMIFIHGDIGLSDQALCPPQGPIARSTRLVLDLSARLLFGPMPEVPCVTPDESARASTLRQMLALLTLVCIFSATVDLLPLAGTNGFRMLTALVEHAWGPAFAARLHPLITVQGCMCLVVLLVLMVRHVTALAMPPLPG